MENNGALKLERPWAEVRERIKESDISLTDADLQYEPGNEAALLGHLSRKLNKSTADVKMWIENLSFNTAQSG